MRAEPAEITWKKMHSPPPNSSKAKASLFISFPEEDRLFIFSILSEWVRLLFCQLAILIKFTISKKILIGHYTNFWPLLIWTLLPNLTFYLIVQGFHRTYATGAACQQRTLTPPDTWSCPTLGLACVLMSRPTSPELVLSPDFWISNTPRYFSFALRIPPRPTTGSELFWTGMIPWSLTQGFFPYFPCFPESVATLPLSLFIFYVEQEW